MPLPLHLLKGLEVLEHLALTAPLRLLSVEQFQVRGRKD